MATVSTTSGPFNYPLPPAPPAPGQVYATNTTWTTGYAVAEVVYKSHLEELEKKHLTIIKDQEERIVALEELVGKLRDRLDEYIGLVSSRAQEESI